MIFLPSNRNYIKTPLLYEKFTKFVVTSDITNEFRRKKRKTENFHADRQRIRTASAVLQHRNSASPQTIGLSANVLLPPIESGERERRSGVRNSNAAEHRIGSDEGRPVAVGPHISDSESGARQTAAAHRTRIVRLPPYELEDAHCERQRSAAAVHSVLRRDENQSSGECAPGAVCGPPPSEHIV